MVRGDGMDLGGGRVAVPMSHLLDIPEVTGLDARRGIVRIPPELDVPMTHRVRQILDAPEFRRLARISQLGLVSLVYPAALHTRFEHSLGVFRLALLLLKRLAHDERFAETIGPEDARLFMVAALLHDLGHWPFCHPIEDICLPGVPTHEMFANSFLLEGEIADALRHDWDIQPRDVVAILSEKPGDPASRILRSMLSGPVDIDKMDYLFRDSLHAGVPYGRNFDQERLIGSLCLNAAGDALAISDKGKTAAEMMVFARYVMFSEVYWHHGVRAATAMLQRAFYLLHGTLDLDALFRLAEGPMIAEMTDAAARRARGRVARGAFRAVAATVQTPCAIQPVRSSGRCTIDSPGGRIPGWRRVPSSSRRWRARRWAGWSRRTRSSSTPRRSTARSSSTSRSTMPRRTATGRWTRSRRSCGRWPRTSSTTT